MPNLIKANFIVDLATAVARRWTRYRGFTAAGQRGLVVGGNYYRSTNIEVPGLDRKLNVAPLDLTLAIDNTDNLATDLVFDGAAVGARVTITKLTFADTPWEEGLPPVIASTTLWFEGFLGRPSFRGGTVALDCHADIGRRGKSPWTSSRTLMLTHTPPLAGAKITVTVMRG